MSINCQQSHLQAEPTNFNVQRQPPVVSTFAGRNTPAPTMSNTTLGLTLLHCAKVRYRCTTPLTLVCRQERDDSQRQEEPLSTHRQSSAGSSTTSFWTGRVSSELRPAEVPLASPELQRTFTLRTLPSRPGNTAVTRPSRQLPRTMFESCTRTMSSTLTLRRSVCHF